MHSAICFPCERVSLLAEKLRVNRELLLPQSFEISLTKMVESDYTLWLLLLKPKNAPL